MVPELISPLLSPALFVYRPLPSSISPAFLCRLFLSVAFLPPDFPTSIVPPSSTSIVPDIIRRFFLLRPFRHLPPLLPSVSSPFRHPFTSRRCTGELVPFRIMLGSLACSFFAVLSVHFSRILARALCCSFRLFILGSFRAMPSPALSFFIKKFAYSNYFLYLCTRNEVKIDPK